MIGVRLNCSTEGSRPQYLCGSHTHPLTPSILSPVLTCASGQAFAQSQNADTVRGLNNCVLQFHSQLQKANAAEAAAIRLQASPVFAQRNAALEALIRQNPPAALGLAFSADLRADLADKFPASAASLEQHGQWRGTSHHVILDDPDRRTSKYEVRLRNGQETIDLYSANGEPYCVSGNIVTAKGIRVNNMLGAAPTTSPTRQRLQWREPAAPHRARKTRWWYLRSSPAWHCLPTSHPAAFRTSSSAQRAGP